MRSAPERVMDYINRLDNYDGVEVAKHAISVDFKLYEEALVIYKKLKMPIDAINVLINKLGSMPRATEFAEKSAIPEVWSALGRAYTD